MFNILSWNCRGVGTDTFKRVYASLIKDHKPRILVLMETYILRDHTKIVSESLGFDSLVQVDPNGFSGVIWVL